MLTQDADKRALLIRAGLVEENTAPALAPCLGSGCPCRGVGRSVRRLPSRADSAQRFLLNCHHFVPCASSRVGFYKSCCAEGSRRGMGEQASASGSLVLARTSPSTPQPVPSVGSVNGTQRSEPCFQSKQTGVGSHPHNSQHCCGSPFWKKCEIYCNTC